MILIMDEHEYKKRLETKDKLLRLKDEQVKTLEDSLKWKDEQIQTLENSLLIKDEKAKTLEKTIELKVEEIRNLNSTVINEDLFNKKNERIKQLEKKLQILNEELSKSDEDFSNLELENEKLRNAQSNLQETKIVDFTSANINKSEILEKIRDILINVISKALIVVPNIEDLQDLNLYEIRSSVSVNIACSINPGIEEHSELLEEYESLDNISLRNYERGDRYVITRDGEELLFGVIGVSENNNMVIHTRDPKHFKLLNDLAQRGWLQSRKF